MLRQGRFGVYTEGAGPARLLGDRLRRLEVDPLAEVPPHLGPLPALGRVPGPVAPRPRNEWLRRRPGLCRLRRCAPLPPAALNSGAPVPRATPPHRDLRRRLDAELHPVRSDLEHRHLDFPADRDALLRLALDDQHELPSAPSVTRNPIAIPLPRVQLLLSQLHQRPSNPPVDRITARDGVEHPGRGVLQRLAKHPLADSVRNVRCGAATRFDDHPPTRSSGAHRPIGGGPRRLPRLDSSPPAAPRVRPPILSPPAASVLASLKLHAPDRDLLGGLDAHLDRPPPDAVDHHLDPIADQDPVAGPSRQDQHLNRPASRPIAGCPDSCSSWRLHTLINDSVYRNRTS
jgi:hypothetical protein